MALSNDLATLFAKTTQDKQETKKESTAYGKIVKQDGKEYVQLDGSDLLTPVSSTTVVQDGDRVIVTIKNHTAIVTGDLTNPSASNKEVEEIGNKISEFDIVIADKVSTEQLEAEMARIEQLRVNDLTATNAKFETIEGKVAEIDTIKADVIEVSGKVTAHEGEFTTLRADIADFKDVTAESIEAIEGEFHTLESDYATFEETVTNKLTANEATIKDLQTNKLDTTTANITYANIDFSNIKEAAIEKLFSDSGIIKDLIMSDGKVTGELVGVTIKGDLIEGNTVKADKLVIQGEDGLYYKLNVNALGETTASSDEKYQNGLDGSVIVAESITAEKVAVDDLVAFGATIGGFHIDDNALYSGVKSAIDNTTDGIFLGDDGQVNIGNSNNYLKFYKDQNGAYKLEIQASSIKFGASNTTIEEAIEEANNKINDMQIGGRNLLLDTATWYGNDSCGDSITSNIDSEKGTLTITSTGGTSDDAWYIPPLSDYDYNKRIRLIEENLQIGDSFIFSMKIKSSDSTVLPKIQFKTFLEYYDFVGNLSSEYSIIYYKGIWTESYANHADPVQIVLDFSECVGTYVLKEAKFEKSTILTEWTPAPEDIETAKWDAIYIAESDATDKANTAETNATNAAKEYTDDQITIVNKTITDEVAEINVTTNSISQKVSSVETTVSTKANASDVYSKTDVDSKINGIEIGGRNLLLDSKKQTGLSDQYLIASYTISEAPLTIGEQYTVSINITSTEERTGWSAYLGGGLYMLTSSFKPLTPGTNTYTETFTLRDHQHASGSLINIYASTTGSTQGSTPIAGTANVNWIKLEKGNKATDWTPAPEDIDSTINDKLDDFKIGGRNLIRNSAFLDDSNYWKLTASTSIDNEQTLNGHPSLYISVSDKTANAYMGAGNYSLPEKDGLTIKSGETWTISSWCYVEDVSTIDVAIGLEVKGYKEGVTSSSTIAGIFISPSNIVEGNWIRYTKTFTASEDFSKCYICSYVTRNGTVWWTDFKLEQGNKVTDWTPAPEDVDEAIETVIIETNVKTSNLDVKTDGIIAEVANVKTIQETTISSIGTINTDITSLKESVETKMDSNSVDIAINTALQNGVTQVNTTTGFTFNEDGLTISKTGKEMTTTIDENGMEIKRNEDTQLLANNEGVIAYDLHAKTYLIVGENSRFEDYTKNGKKQTGCFWIGDTEVSS